MWEPTRIEQREVEMDFTSSEQGRPRVKQVLLDGVLFANATRFTDWSEPTFQTIVCSACGHDGCEPGNWITARRAGELVLLMPDFDGMLDDYDESAPPNYLKERGALLFNPANAERLRSLIPDLRPFEKLKGLRGLDAKRIAQFEAPHNMLGRFPVVPTVRKNHVDWCSHGEAKEALRKIAQALSDLVDHQPVRVRRRLDGEEVVTFGLAGAEWAPLVTTEGKDRLHLDPNWVVEPYVATEG